jgi:hypothetical protein
MNERIDAVSPADKLVTLTEEELAGVSGGDVKPTEQISLSFGKIELVYRPQ